MRFVSGIDQNSALVFSKFNFMFGVHEGSKHDACINALIFLCLKHYLYTCKFQKIEPNFAAYVSYIKFKQKIEYTIAQKGTNFPYILRNGNFN